MSKGKWKKEIKVGDEVEYISQKRIGKTVTFETKKGKAVKFRTVNQVLIQDGKTLKWIDIDPEKEDI